MSILCGHNGNTIERIQRSTILRRNPSIRPWTNSKGTRTQSGSTSMVGYRSQKWSDGTMTTRWQSAHVAGEENGKITSYTVPMQKRQNIGRNVSKNFRINWRKPLNPGCWWLSKKMFVGGYKIRSMKHHQSMKHRCMLQCRHKIKLDGRISPKVRYKRSLYHINKDILPIKKRKNRNNWPKNWEHKSLEGY